MIYDMVLVPTGDSDAVDPTLEHVFDLAEAFDATVHASYVADTNRDGVTVVGTEVVDALVEVGEEAVASIVERGKRRAPVVDEVARGGPV